MQGQHFIGSFKLTSQENLDEYLQAIGVGFGLRKLASSASVTLDCSVLDDEWTFVIKSLKSNVMKFKLGVEQDHETPDGRKVKLVFNLDGDKLVQNESWDDKKSTLVHEIQEPEWILTMGIGNIRCVRRFTRVGI